MMLGLDRHNKDISKEDYLKRKTTLTITRSSGISNKIEYRERTHDGGYYKFPLVGDCNE
jgi:hypothetical protein